MEKKGAKGYLFAFFQVQTAITAPLLFRTMFLPPQSRTPGIIIFFILLLAGSLTFFENKKLVPLLQVVAGFALIACIAMAAVIGPIGEILFDTFGGTPHIGRLFARIPAYSLPVSPFQIIWVIDDMVSSSAGGGFLRGMFNGNPLFLYYVHAGVGFVFWLWYLVFISFRDSRGLKSETDNTGGNEISNHSEMTSKKSAAEQNIPKADTGPLSGEFKKLHAFAKEKLSKSLQELEQYRRIVKSDVLHDHIYFGLTITGAIIFGFHASVRMITDESPFGIVFFIIIAVWAVVFLIYWPQRVAKDKKRYLREFKSKVVSPLIGFIDPTLSYDPEGKIDKLTFERGGMVSTKRSMYNGTDLITGSREGRSFALSTISVIKRTLRYSGYMTLFNGLYCTVSLESSLRGYIYLIPNQRKYTGLRRNIKLKSNPDKLGEQVSSGNEQFDQFFYVYSTHPEEVKTALNPDFLDRYISFLHDQNTPVFFVFVGAPAQSGQSGHSDQTDRSGQPEMHAAIPRQQNAFEPPLFSSLVDFDVLVRCYRELNYCLRIVELPL